MNTYKRFLLFCSVYFSLFQLNAQIFESFEYFDGTSSYASSSFMGNNNIMWNYVNAKSGQLSLYNKGKAICLNKSADAVLFSDSIAGGCSQISFFYEQAYSTNLNFQVYINDSLIASITSQSEQGESKLFSVYDLHIEGNYVVKIVQVSASSGQLTIDDISTFPYVLPSSIARLLSYNITNDTLTLQYSKNIDTSRLSSRKFITNNDIVFHSYYCEGSQLKLSISLHTCKESSISIVNLFDVNGLSILDTTLIITPSYIPQFGDIVFTEIMFDPTPVVTLPNAEYFELYNKSECIIDMSKIIYFNNSKAIELPKIIVNPSEYIVFTSSSNIPEFYDYQNAFALSEFPALLNDGAMLSLKNIEGEMISYVNYSPTQHKSDFKRDGGWSLEAINPILVCSGNKNWTSSINEAGGTPGTKNSVDNDILDYSQPKILYAACTSDTTVAIYFDKYISSSSIESINSFKMSDNDINIVKYEFTSVMNNSISVLLSKPLSKNKKYTITVNSNISDCDGNTILNNEISFAQKQTVKNNDIVINELLFNPYENGYDFVEIYNRSEKYISLKDLYIAKKSDKGEIQEYYQISENDIILFPNNFLVISQSCDNIKENYDFGNEAICLDMMRLPSFPNKSGNVYIILRTGEEIASFYYDEKMHHEIIRDVKGVSLERVNYDIPSNQNSNWQSATYDVGFATPGYENSQYVSLSESESEFNIYPQTISPNNDGTDDFLVLEYDFEQEGIVATIYILTDKGVVVKKIIENLSLSSKGIITWDAINDADAIVNQGLYIAYIKAFCPLGKTYLYKKAFAVVY